MDERLVIAIILCILSALLGIAIASITILISGWLAVILALLSFMVGRRVGAIRS